MTTITFTKRQHPARPHSRQRLVGHHAGPFGQLASAYLDVAYDRLAGIRHVGRRPAAVHRQLAGRASPGQRAAARGQCRAAVPGLAGDDRLHLAQRPGGSPVCHPPAASRIGGLGHRTQGHAQRTVLPAHARGLLCLQRPSFLLVALWAGPRQFRLRTDRQIDVGDDAVCIALARTTGPCGGSRRPPATTGTAFPACSR